MKALAICLMILATASGVIAILSGCSTWDSINVGLGWKKAYPVAGETNTPPASPVSTNRPSPPKVP